MGNYISCTLPGAVSRSTIKGTKVIFPSGETRRLHEPTKAAELMLENPNSFIVSAKSLQIGRRFSALNADDDLQMGGVYVASRISPECGGGVCVVETTSVKCSAGKLNLDDFEEFSTPEFKHRLSMSRSKKPSLETIDEEPLCVR
ncbi:hypothetical protein ABFS82_12G018400 [Erythranthe guttata]|uniref:Uncharacterized protein n=1 Tax=Erythranthe guttata TaxID=4155 RepID=A0A022R1R5_ERYGU|nr:hypothetical protein MIMGU_mgv1a020327mg [Erythranthe guttata]